MIESTSSPSSYENVLHRKTEGKLELTKDVLTFQDASNNGNTSPSVNMSWDKIVKHQVSPASHPKSLLKIVLVEGAGKPLTFQFSNREELERIRKDITQRLQYFRSQHSTLLSSSPPATLTGSKRRHSDISTPSSAAAITTIGKTTSTSFGELDPTSLAVVRSSLLATNPTLRAQHQYLVVESQTVEEDDFWETHSDLLEEEYARIAGITRAGTSSLLQSHLQLLTGRITLGVEEMRQIFIMYPAVHKAYEEKVPLELSDEQFWRKYLESEYFHRDRGRIGAASRKNATSDAKSVNGKDNGNTNNNSTAKKTADQEARAAAVGTDDLFSRYDQKLRESGQLDDGVYGTANVAAGDVGAVADGARHKKWGTRLAIGQFDLASTFETERGNLLEGPKDNHPIDPAEDDKSAKVIQKYNRHWAMVLNPEDAVAGSNLMEVARKSVDDAIPDDEDAKAGGGLDEEMQRLVGFANSNSQEANHALGMGESDEYETLTLKNIEVYHFGHAAQSTGVVHEKEEEEMRKKNGIFSSAIVNKINSLAQTNSGATIERTKLDYAFPPPQLGRDLLVALTKKMVEDAKTDADTLEVVNSLPATFKKRLHSYFRRSSELLRHFFGLRRLADASQGSSSVAYNQKLQRIVKGMEIVYREMDEMRKEQETTGRTGEIMRKMCLQIMDQLDWAFKLHREGTGSGGGGGFVTIEEF